MQRKGSFFFLFCFSGEGVFSLFGYMDRAVAPDDATLYIEFFKNSKLVSYNFQSKRRKKKRSRFVVGHIRSAVGRLSKEKFFFFVWEPKRFGGNI